jgi:hypothetical protein
MRMPAGASHGYLAETPVQLLVLDCDPANTTDRLRCLTNPQRTPATDRSITPT